MEQVCNLFSPPPHPGIRRRHQPGLPPTFCHQARRFPAAGTGSKPVPLSPRHLSLPRDHGSVQQPEFARHRVQQQPEVGHEDRRHRLDHAHFLPQPAPRQPPDLLRLIAEGMGHEVFRVSPDGVMGVLQITQGLHANVRARRQAEER